MTLLVVFTISALALIGCLETIRCGESQEAIEFRRRCKRKMGRKQ